MLTFRLIYYRIQKCISWYVRFSELKCTVKQQKKNVNMKLNPETLDRGRTEKNVPTIKQTKVQHALSKTTNSVVPRSLFYDLWSFCDSVTYRVNHELQCRYLRDKNEVSWRTTAVLNVLKTCKTSHYYIKSKTPDKKSYECARFAVLSAVKTKIKILGCYAASTGKQTFGKSVSFHLLGLNQKQWWQTLNIEAERSSETSISLPVDTA